jgi:hypothetical protein
VASDPKYNLWQAKLSPNGRWIAFVAVNREDGGAATIAVIPSGGAPAGQWKHITEAHAWADQPRWSAWRSFGLWGGSKRQPIERVMRCRELIRPDQQSLIVE